MVGDEDGPRRLPVTVVGEERTSPCVEFRPGTGMGEALKRKQKKRTGREGMVSRVVRPGLVC